MKFKLFLIATYFIVFYSVSGQSETAQNPIVYSDVPDLSMIRVGDTYYMSSTTMHMSPGVPIMRSTDLVNWELVSYAYNTLSDINALSLSNGQNSYGRGSWASCLRYYNGTFYVSTFAGTTGKTYVYSTRDIEKGLWTVKEFQPSYHDHSIFFDDDGKVYMIWGGGKIQLVELKEDLSNIKVETKRTIIENASAPAGDNIMLKAEGSQLFKINGRYYLFNIVWPRGGMRTVLIHRADQILGPYEGRVALQDKGIAQGGLINTPEGDWYAYLFRDYGAVGRIPYLVPVKWKEGWPVLGNEGKVPDSLDLPSSKGLIPGIVASDDFNREKGDPDLPLVWQWNHNPVDSLWSVKDRKGYLRLTTGRTDAAFTMARNTLTQRTIGPLCSGITSIDISDMKNGDFAGLSLLQKNYGLVGVIRESNTNKIVMISLENEKLSESESISLTQETVYLKAECNFRDQQDIAKFYYSLDCKNWKSIGSQLKMRYTLPHFMGYRFGLFYYATETSGGYVDFDYFQISDNIMEE